MGTDTGVGKTTVAAALVAALRSRGLNAGYMKPVQTGCSVSAGRLRPPDVLRVMRWSGWVPDEALADWVCPYRFRPACSPHLAARLAGKAIRRKRLVRAFQKLSAAYEPLVVEGAGGLLVPLNSRGETMLDIARDFDLPVAVVGRPGLGTLNHTFLTVDRARREGLRVVGVVLVRTRGGRPSFIERNNVATLRSWLGLPVSVMNFIPRYAQRRQLPDSALKAALEWWSVWSRRFSAMG